MAAGSNGMGLSSSQAEIPPTIPILDLQHLLSDPLEFREQLRDACHRVGFFLLRHDIPLDVTQSMLREVGLFFDASLDDKMKISYEQFANFRGYMKMGVENTAGKTDLREQVEFATEDNPADKRWPPYERLRGINPWPEFQPTLRQATLAYVEHVQRVAECLRDALLELLQLNNVEQIFGSYKKREKAHWVVKLVRYPPQEGLELGVGAHTDTNFLTIILQDDAGGLQVFAEDHWVDVPADPSLLVCNLGEQCQMLSQGYFLATPHRVVAPTQRMRLSVPFFYNPLLSATLRPQSLPFYFKWDREISFQKDKWQKSGVDDMILTSVGENTFKSLARSHPNAFHRHHSDLLLLASGKIIRKDEFDVLEKPGAVA